MANGKCRIHGGTSTGPRTPEGLERSRKSNWNHGLRSAEAIRQIANGLVFLGLIGTVIGFIIALSGVDPSRATEVDNVARMIATLISGMSVAMYTTLAGSVLYVWLSVNHRILANGSVSLITAIIKLGERRERL